jgi:hypothetical protein
VMGMKIRPQPRPAGRSRRGKATADSLAECPGTMRAKVR